MKNNDCFEILGGNKLYGTIVNQTSKNATLPILSACLLSEGELVLKNLPNITDVKNMLKILRKIGVKVKRAGNRVCFDSTHADNPVVDAGLSKTMRSSLFLLGSMLSKFGVVDLTFPGGCKIGERPIDLHISSFKKLGVEVNEFDKHIIFSSIKPKANKIKLKIPSVGATENIILFACKLKGKTTIINAAREPEVVDLCNFLNQMGAKILGAGTSKITIYGVNKLCGATYKPMGDRIVAGTIMSAVALTGGDVTIFNAVPYQNLKLIEILRLLGCQIEIKNDILHIVRRGILSSVEQISTGYYPNFPTDLQSFMLVLSTVTHGKTIIQENIFENRFLTVPELNKMGADIKLKNSKTVEVNGVKNLIGDNVQAMDLRGGASLVLAGLVATGKTTVKNVHFIDRGYERLESMLSNLGANIKRI